MSSFLCVCVKKPGFVLGFFAKNSENCERIVSDLFLLYQLGVLNFRKVSLGISISYINWLSERGRRDSFILLFATAIVF